MSKGAAYKIISSFLISTALANAEIPEVRFKYPLPPLRWGGDVVMVFAHADDELTTLNEVIRLRSLRPGQPIHWIIVSDNAKGKVFPGSCIGVTKAECRAREAAEVAKCIGIFAPHFLNFPDGGLHRVSQTRLVEAITRKIRAIGRGRKIGLILSNDAVGLYGHPDHIAVHDASRTVAKNLRIPQMSAALPVSYQRRFFGDEGAGRPFPAITHRSLLNERSLRQIVCSHDAYDSQMLTLSFMRGLASAENFLRRLPVQFLNLAFPAGYKKTP